MTRRPAAPALFLLLSFFPLQEALLRVTQVIDGDTIEVEVDGSRERVRYIGIDTPERDDERPEVRAMARRATEANRRLVGGRRVRLEFDAEERDRYGRLLAYVWVGDTLVNERLLREGYAQLLTIPPNVRYAERFLAAQREAREEGLGLWSERAGDVPLGAIPASEAELHVGERATVCGAVTEARHVARTRGRPTFLNFGPPFPRHDFTVVIWGAARERFPHPPEEMFAGREVCVEGTITRYRGTPQIVVEDPEAIRIREAASLRGGTRLRGGG